MVDPKCFEREKVKVIFKCNYKIVNLHFEICYLEDSQNFKRKLLLGNSQHKINPGEKVGEVAALRCSLDSTISWVSQNDSLDLLCHKFLKKKLHESPSGHAMCVKILQTISLTPCIDGAL